MKIFLDTSSLFKLYHREEDTVIIEQIFSQVLVTDVYLSEITKVEFTSSVWKKVRTKEITELEAHTTLQLFERDCDKYTFIATDSIIIEQARNLTTKYGLKGLRTLDSIQLSSAISLTKEVGLFVVSDNLLKLLLNEEGLQTEMPSG
jgi:predicted nucleic acid-binding protein